MIVGKRARSARRVLAAALSVALFGVLGPANVARAATGAFVAEQTLDGRSAKDMSNHAYPNKYPAGSVVTVLCQDSGPVTYNGDTIWDLTSDHLWVTDYYIKTGHSGFTDAVSRCTGGQAPNPGTAGRPFTTTQTLDGRTAKDMGNHAYPNRYPSGGVVYVQCQDYGPVTYSGNTIWDYTSDGLWITDYYVRTGYSGLDSDLPRCSPDEPPTGSTGPHSFQVTATLDGRTAKDLTNHAYPNRYPAGYSVNVQCQDSGPVAYGSSVWDLTTDGLWVADYYVRTGYSGFDPNLPRCSGGSTPPPAHTYVVTTTLDGRTAKTLSNHAYVDRYPDGSSVTITCQAYGTATYGGSYIWDKTSDGLWVVDYYVKTGTDGFVSGLPRCDNDQPDYGPQPPAPPTNPPPPSPSGNVVQGAIAAARAAAQAHPDYAYGGGHGATPGPTYGFCDGVNGYLNGVCVANQRIGYDCSGLMRWSYYQATGVDFGSGSTFTMYGWRNDIYAASHHVFNQVVHSVNDLQPGDMVLVRWEGSGPGHVVMVTSGQGATSNIIEAPNTRSKLREVSWSYDSYDFVIAYRPT